MKNPTKTVPDLSASSSIHQEAIKLGKEHFLLSARNVIDKFKNWADEDIKQELRKTANPFAVCFENWIGDFNLATGVRNADAFNAREVFYLGNKKIDRRGMVGCQNRVDIQFLASVDELVKLQDRYTLIGVDNIPGAVPIDEYQFKKDSLFIFGEEGVGLTPGSQSLCQDMIYIRQFGAVRSLNCGTASGIIMFSYMNNII